MTFADGSRRDVQSRELRCPKNAKQVTYKGERGYYHDPNLGSAESTFYLHHRVYGETEGRFKSRDPAEDDPNLYRYVRNNPVNQVDPSGLEKVEVDEDGTVWVYPESWWFGIDYDDSRIKVGQLAEYTTTTVSGQGPGNKYTIIVTPMRRVGIDGESHPIILHYSHFEQFVHSYDFTNIRSVHVGDYIREEGFSVNRTREQVHRSAGFAATQMDQFARSYTLYAAYAEFTDAVIDEAATRAVTAGVAGGLTLKLLRRGKKADDLADAAKVTARRLDDVAPGNVARAGQKLGRSPSSTILGENLEAAGKVRPPNSAAHHVVAGTDPRAAQARAILQREGIDINEAANGVFLPKNTKYAAPPAQTHSTAHTNRYYDEVNLALSRAAPGTVRDVLADIERQLLNGTFPN